MRREFNKNKFAVLLKNAMGDRSINQYALHCGISPTYISRLLREKVENPPMPPTIEKLSSKAYNGVAYEEFMAAAGHLPDRYLAESPSEYEANKKSNIDFIYDAQTYKDALDRIVELDMEYDFDDETMFKIIKKARQKYKPRTETR